MGLSGDLETGNKYIINEDIVIDGKIAFEKDAWVLIEKVEPNQQSPEHKYVVYSSHLGKLFQLSDINFTPADKPGPRLSGKQRLPVTPSSSSQRNGLTPKRRPLQKCHKCGHILGPKDYVCGDCGYANVPLVKSRAKKFSISPMKCDHYYRRYYHHRGNVAGWICIDCGFEKPKGVPPSKTHYTSVSEYCEVCGVQLSGSKYCTKCGARITAAQTQRAAATGSRPAYWPGVQRPGPYGQNPVAVPSARNVPLAGSTVNSASERASAPEVCRNCGASLPPDSAFCEACGSAVAITAPLEPGARHHQARQAAKRQSKTRNMGTAGTILLVAGVFLLLIGIVLASRNDDEGIYIPGSTEEKHYEITNRYTGEKSADVYVEQQAPPTPVSFKSIGYVMGFFGIVALVVGFILLMQSIKLEAAKAPGVPPARAGPTSAAPTPQKPTTVAQQPRPPDATPPAPRPVIEIAEVPTERD